DMLGEEVVPVLREEFAKGRGADVPEAPTHRSLLAAQNTQNTRGAQEEKEESSV
ncbi:5,10-methylene tetrahydromethanopterin reductase, partial [Streptomyces sp. NPDC052721]